MTMIYNDYDNLLSMLLEAEGNMHSLQLKKNYDQQKKIHIPHTLMPLLYAASNITQISAAFLPYYDRPKYSKEHYAELLKFLLRDIMRTQMVVNYKPNVTKRKKQRKNIFLYDPTYCKYPPFYGITIQNFEPQTLPNLDVDFYLVGDITRENLQNLCEKIDAHPIYGITPQQSNLDNWQEFLKYRLNFFSKTMMAGSINIQLPLIEHYFQMGLAPISFYYLLFRHQYHHVTLSNALCLFHNRTPLGRLSDDLNYKRLNAHTDLYCNAQQGVTAKKNYLNLLNFG